MDIEELKEKQDKELVIKLITKTVDGGFQLVGYEKAEENLRNFIDKVIKEVCESKDKEYADFAEKMNTTLFEVEKRVRKETAEMVCDRMIDVVDDDWCCEKCLVEDVKKLKKQIIKEP